MRRIRPIPTARRRAEWRTPLAFLVPLALALLALALLALALLAGCARDTSRLTPAWQQRLDAEGIVRRADNVVLRHTREAGRYRSGYKDRLASVVVTHQTILIHQGERELLEVTPRTRREITVTRQGVRVRIRAVGQRAVEIFSFEPKEDAAGWAEDLRAVAKSIDENPPRSS